MAVTSKKFEYSGRGLGQETFYLNFAVGDKTGTVLSSFTTIYGVNITPIGTVSAGTVLLSDAYWNVGTTFDGTVSSGITSSVVTVERCTGTVITGTQVAASYFVVAYGK